MSHLMAHHSVCLNTEFWAASLAAITINSMTPKAYAISCEALGRLVAMPHRDQNSYTLSRIQTTRK
jgi:hypothetical protein